MERAMCSKWCYVPKIREVELARESGVSVWEKQEALAMYIVQGGQARVATPGDAL